MEETVEEKVSMKHDQDNRATVSTIVHEVTSWRARHYALRAAGVRDLVAQEGIVVEHVKGVEIIADPLTKVLAKNKLREAYLKLQMGPNEEDA